MKRAAFLLAAVGAVVGLALAAPAFADDAEDFGVCLDEEASGDARIGACTRLIDGDFGTPAERSEVYRSRGDVLFDRDEDEAALADYSEATRLDPESALAFSGKGQAELALDDYEAARISLERAIALNPESYWEYNRLAYTMNYLGDEARALELLTEALDRDPESYSSLSLRATLHARAERYEDAITDATAGIALRPRDAFLYSLRGYAHEQLGQPDAAIGDYRVANLLEPDLLTPYWGLRNLADLGRADDDTPFRLTPPEPGLTIVYLEVFTEAPVDDPVLAATFDLLDFDPPRLTDEPTATRRVRTVLGTTEGAVTQYADTPLDGGGAGVAVPRDLAFAMMPVVTSQRGAPDFFLDYGEAPFPELRPGETATGEGEVAIECPEEPGTLTTALGCTEGVTRLALGAHQWTVTFEGWENIALPLGERVTAKLVFGAVTTLLMFGQEIEGTAAATWWFDPVIGWWLRNERDNDGQLRVLEALAIE